MNFVIFKQRDDVVHYINPQMINYFVRYRADREDQSIVIHFQGDAKLNLGSLSQAEVEYLLQHLEKEDQT